MESENKDILERNVSEKMCSSGSNGAGEICSPGTADTRGDGSIDVTGSGMTREKCLIFVLSRCCVSKVEDQD